MESKQAGWPRKDFLGGPLVGGISYYQREQKSISFQRALCQPSNLFLKVKVEDFFHTSDSLTKFGPKWR